MACFDNKHPIRNNFLNEASNDGILFSNPFLESLLSGVMQHSQTNTELSKNQYSRHHPYQSSIGKFEGRRRFSEPTALSQTNSNYGVRRRSRDGNFFLIWLKII